MADLSFRYIVFWRHIVGIGLVLLAQNPQLYSGGMMLAGLWVGSLLISLTVAAIITGIASLLLNETLKGRISKIFVIAAWIVAALQLFGEWWLPRFVGQQTKLQSVSTDIANSNVPTIQSNKVNQIEIGTKEESNKREGDRAEKEALPINWESLRTPEQVAFDDFVSKVGRSGGIDVDAARAKGISNEEILVRFGYEYSGGNRSSQASWVRYDKLAEYKKKILGKWDCLPGDRSLVKDAIFVADGTIEEHTWSKDPPRNNISSDLRFWHLEPSPLGIRLVISSLSNGSEPWFNEIRTLNDKEMKRVAPNGHIINCVRMRVR